MRPYFRIALDGAVEFGFLHEFGAKELYTFSVLAAKDAQQALVAAKVGDPVEFVKKRTKRNPDGVQILHRGKKLGVIHPAITDYAIITLLIRDVPEHVSGSIEQPFDASQRHCLIKLEAKLPA
jgi:hypothetical protein